MQPKLKTTVITGRLKGRVLTLPQNEAARPTRSRIRQAAFNILGSHLDFDGLNVAELCCGSGAWGIEAFSRGAAAVWLIDTDIRTVQQNVRHLAIEADAHVVKADAAQWQAPQPLDVVLADPPYADQGLLKKLLMRAPQLSATGAYWLLETAAGAQVPWPNGFEVLQSRLYGASALHLARWHGEIAFKPRFA